MTPEQQTLLNQIAEAVIHLNQDKVKTLTQQAISLIPPQTIISEGLSRGMQTVGEQFKNGEIFIPEVMVACDCYYAGLNLVKPLLKDRPRETILGRIVIGTIHGDIHTVGKDVAVPVFEAAGFDVIDLGVAVPDEAFVEAVQKYQPDIVGLGTYMTATFMHTRETVEKLRQAALRERVKVICGGPSVTGEAARRLGADDASNNAWEAVEIMRRWMEQKRTQTA